VPGGDDAVIGVWFASTDVDAGTLQKLEALLTDEERLSLTRLRVEDDRRRRLVGRGLLRAILSRLIGSDPGIVIAAGGKPKLRGGELEFNVSHSGALILIAIGSAPVGVDVERVRDLGSDLESVTSAHFSADEQGRCRGGDDFFGIWTAKEAVVKAAGGGLSMPLASFSVPELSSAFLPVAGFEEWSVRMLTPPREGYRSAIATSTRETESGLAIRDLEPEEIALFVES
jgi:4'-phosphopantetheinyl transferase